MSPRHSLSLGQLSLQLTWRGLRRAFVACVVVTAIGCQGHSALPPEPRAVQASSPTKPSDGGEHDEGSCPIVYAPARVSKEPIPSRFSAPIPSSTAVVSAWSTVGDPKLPPFNYVRDQICQGDPAMLKRYRAALVQHAATLDDPADAGPRALSFQCGSPVFCAFARDLLASTEHSSLKASMWQALTECQDSDTQVLFESGSAEPEVYLSWHSHFFFFRSGDGYTARFEEAVSRLVSSGNVQSARDSVWQLAEFRTERSARKLLELYDAAKSDELRQVLALQLKAQPHPRAAGLFAKACKREPDARECRQESGLSSFEDFGGASPFARVLRRYSPRAIAQARADQGADLSAMRTELTRCVLESQPHRNDCLVRLAAVDWAAAARVARRTRADAEPRLRETLSVLARFNSPGEFDQFLLALGLPRPKQAGPETQLPTPDVREALARRGIVAELRLGESRLATGAAYKNYDSMLRQLFALGGKPLVGTLLEAPIETHGARARFALTGYVAGKRIRTTAADIADEFIEHVADQRNVASTVQLGARGLIGFANTVARESGSDQRFVLAGADPLGGAMTTVVASRRALCELMRLGLLVPELRIDAPIQERGGANAGSAP